MEIKNYKVSIITPVYNCEDFIAETIQSILDQTHANFELLLIDDNSSDDTIEIIKSFNDPRIVLLENGENKGAAFSRNKGLSNATGDYIAFLDADDLWEERKLEKCLNFMLSNNYDFIYSNYSVVKDDGSATGTVISGPKKITHKMFVRSNYIGCSTVVYKREIYPDLQIPETIKKRNDYALWLLLSKKADCYLLDECLVKYRKNSFSISSGHKSGLIKHHYQVFREVCGYSVLKAFVCTLLNICFYLLRRKKYWKNQEKSLKNTGKFEKGFFVVLTIILCAFVFAFGYSINGVKAEATYLNVTNFSKNNPNVQLTVSTSGGLDFDQCDKYMLEIYPKKKYLSPYYMFDGQPQFEYKGNKHDITLCTSPVYYDFAYTEYLALPLYKHDSAIKKGPLNGANFACYIPSSLADSLLDELNLSNYDELFAENVVFTVNEGINECTMSINNIYLNNETTHWNSTDIAYDFYKILGRRNPNAILSYCPSFFKKIGNGCLRFEMNTSYDHIKSITNSTLDFYEDPLTTVSYKITREDGKTMSYSFSKQDLYTDFGDFNHIIIYIGIGVLICNFVILMLSKSFRRHMMKPALITSGIVLFILFVGEILKTIFSTQAWPFLIFNYIGNGVSVVILIYILVLSYYFKEEKEND